MKWILLYIIVTSNGVTESQSDFDTLEECDKAAAELHETWGPKAIAVQTECKPNDD